MLRKGILPVARVVDPTAITAVKGVPALITQGHAAVGAATAAYLAPRFLNINLVEGGSVKAHAA